ncbi:MAG: hypothetical protein CMJ78_09100 [Planctomycetaceae bacterium]|nr:hypothetical protein [Planctomycetaceae bacterium]
MNLCGLLNARNLLAASKDVVRPPRIRSCVFLFYYGGPSHLDTYDMKPNASSSVRGEFNPISSSVPGLQVCEHLPRMAKLMHKVAIVRSMHHTNRLHDSASTETFTGRQGPMGDREEFAPIAQFYPCHGSALTYYDKQQSIFQHQQAGEIRDKVTHATLPFLFHNVVTTPCQGGGFLGDQYDPFLISGNASKVSYSAEMLKRPNELSLERIEQRRQLLSQIETERTLQATTGTRQLDSFSKRAYELLDSKDLPITLKVEKEPAAIRERYGLKPDAALKTDAAAASSANRILRGQNLLLARRLVEAGVPFVNVQDFRQQGRNWDSHQDNFGQHKRILLPTADQALSAFLEDMDDRGLLDSTLVVALGEFGRTPKINGNAGRDHWPDCYSIFLAGGGVRGGQVYGSSDRIGAYPDTNPCTPADLAATIYWCFGLDHRAEIHDHTGRPHRLSDGRPLTELFG